MPTIDYDNSGSSIASVTILTHTEVYDGLKNYNSAADVFVNQTVQAFQATWSSDITRDIAISLDSFRGYQQELSRVLRAPTLARIFGEAGAGALIGGAYGRQAQSRAQRAAASSIAELRVRKRLPGGREEKPQLG